jgi:hypothetical protein
MKKIGRRSEGNGAKMARKRKQPDQKAEKFPLRLEWRSPAELAENPRNWRTHPENQQAALAGAMTEVGWAGACLFNEATGRLIDGHLRRKVAQAQGCDLVPVLVGTWTEDQEAKILATLDPLAGMAGADPVILDDLLKGVHTGCDDLRDMLTDLWDDVQADAIAGTEPAEHQDAEPQETIGKHYKHAGLGVFVAKRSCGVEYQRVVVWKATQDPIETERLADAISDVIKEWCPVFRQTWTVTNPPRGCSSGDKPHAAGLLAKQVANVLGLDYAEMLERVGERKWRGSRNATREQIFNAVKVPHDVCLIIDDMATTGNTLRGALKALRSVGVPAFGFAYYGHD